MKWNENEIGFKVEIKIGIKIGFENGIGIEIVHLKLGL